MRCEGWRGGAGALLRKVLWRRQRRRLLQQRLFSCLASWLAHSTAAAVAARCSLGQHWLPLDRVVGRLAGWLAFVAIGGVWVVFVSCRVSCRSAERRRLWSNCGGLERARGGELAREDVRCCSIPGRARLQRRRPRLCVHVRLSGCVKLHAERISSREMRPPLPRLEPRMPPLLVLLSMLLLLLPLPPSSPSSPPPNAVASALWNQLATVPLLLEREHRSERASSFRKFIPTLLAKLDAERRGGGGATRLVSSIARLAHFEV